MNEQDTIKTSIFRELAFAFVRIYKQHIFPLPYEQVFYQDGIRIHLLLEKHETPDDTQPIRTAR
jgi:hypothetical protein